MCALELDVSQLHAMASITVAPLAFAARLAGTRLDSRRPRVVRARVPAKSRLVTQSVLKVDDSLNEDAPEDSKSPAVLAAAAVATAIVLAASPAHGAEARPAVDVGAHDYYLETMEASGLRPASIEAKSAPATGLNRFGSAATAADETASLVSTAFAVGLILHFLKPVRRKVEIIPFRIAAPFFSIGPIPWTLTGRFQTKLFHPFGNFLLVVDFKSEMVKSVRLAFRLLR